MTTTIQTDSEGNYIFKILVLGDSRIGKDSVIKRHTDHIFSVDGYRTIQPDHRNKVLILDPSNMTSKKVIFQIWNYQSTQKFNERIPRSFYKNASGYYIMYDLTNKDSFDNVPKWISEIKKNIKELNTLSIEGKDIEEKEVVLSNIIVVGNKSDLMDVNQHVIDLKEVQQYCNSIGAKHFITSAKNCEYVEESFAYLQNLILKSTNIPELQPKSSSSQPYLQNWYSYCNIL